MRAPQAFQASSTRRIDSGRFSGSGVRTTRRSRNRPAVAAAAPLSSAPATGWPGTNCAMRAPSAERAAAITSRLVLPASVTTLSGASDRPISWKMRATCGTGAATSTRSASRAAAAGSEAIESMTRRSRASSRLARLRPAPTTCETLPACFSASANEPPIKPTPMTARRIYSPKLFPEAGRERGEEFLVLQDRADGDAQVLGKLVAAADRPHDHAAAQEAFVNLGRLAHADGEEVAVGRNEVEAEGLRAFLELAQAAQVLGVAARDELHVVQCRRGRGKRDAVHVERLAHAIHDVGDRRMRERVADAQAGKAIRLGEGARQDQVRVAAQPFHAVAAQVGREVFVVGLVHDHQHAFGYP